MEKLQALKNTVITFVYTILDYLKGLTDTDKTFKAVLVNAYELDLAVTLRVNGEYFTGKVASMDDQHVQIQVIHNPEVSDEAIVTGFSDWYFRVSDIKVIGVAIHSATSPNEDYKFPGYQTVGIEDDDGGSDDAVYLD